MKYLMLVWMWLALHWQVLAGLFYVSLLCRLAIDWLKVHELQALVWFGWCWWVLGVLLVLALLMRFVFGGINVQ